MATEHTMTDRAYLELLTKQHAYHARRLYAVGTTPYDDPVYAQRDQMICRLRRKIVNPVRVSRMSELLANEN